MGKLIDKNGNTLLNMIFSTKEIFTGKRWIDGKKIYVTVFLKNNVEIANNVIINHEITNISQVINYSIGTWHNNSGTLIKYHSGVSGSEKGLSVRVSRTEIQFYGNDSWTASTDRTLYAIIYYTKTDD